MTDLRKYSRSTIIRLTIGGLLIAFLVGIIVIWLSYGYRAALLGLICFVGGLSPIVLIFLSLKLMDLIVKRNK